MASASMRAAAAGHRMQRGVSPAGPALEASRGIATFGRAAVRARPRSRVTEPEGGRANQGARGRQRAKQREVALDGTVDREGGACSFSRRSATPRCGRQGSSERAIVRSARDDRRCRCPEAPRGRAAIRATTGSRGQGLDDDGWQASVGRTERARRARHEATGWRRSRQVDVLGDRELAREAARAAAAPRPRQDDEASGTSCRSRPKPGSACES